MDAPIYLKKYTKEIDNLPGFKYQNWFSVYPGRDNYL